MRLSILAIACCLTVQINTNAQMPGGKEDTWKSWSLNYQKEEPNVIRLLQQVYRFPEFANGRIVFRDGKQLVAKMNYNVMKGELRFINAQNDTINIASPENVAYAAIDRYRFYFVKGKYLQRIETKAGVMLAFSQEINTLFKKDYMPYASSNHNANYILNVPAFTDADQQKINFDYEGWAGTTNITKYFYFGDEYGNFVKANRSNLLKYFEKNATVIDQYIEHRDINFNRLADLQDVLNFCATLD
ncbi:MAG: hypothetical protein QM726_23615 [Chitinophagaceae bacterium]